MKKIKMYWKAFYDVSILNQKKKGTCKKSWIDKNIIIMKNTLFILIIIHQLYVIFYNMQAAPWIIIEKSLKFNVNPVKIIIALLQVIKLTHHDQSLSMNKLYPKCYEINALICFTYKVDYHLYLFPEGQTIRHLP